MRPIPRDFPGKEPWRSAAWGEVCRLGVTPEWSEKRGRAFWNDPDWRIRVPTPTTWRRMRVFLHECAHQDLHRVKPRPPRWEQEVECEVWVIARWVDLGLPCREELVAFQMVSIAGCCARGVRAGADPATVAEWQDFADEDTWERCVTPWVRFKLAHGREFERARAAAFLEEAA